MIERALAEAVLREVIAACDPARRVREALAGPEVGARLAGRRRFGVAIGKAALAMARGAGEVTDGVVVVPAGTSGPAPRGWRVMEAAHPAPDERSVAAGAAVRAVVVSAREADVVLALISGGASALVEVPLGPLDELVGAVGAVMAAGAPIAELNAVRGALSAIKAGQLASASAAPVVTLAVSDVIGDALDVIGSGPTVGPWLAGPGRPVDDGASARRARAREILTAHGLPVPAVLAGEPAVRLVTRSDLAAVIAPMAGAGAAAIQALAARGIAASLVERPVSGEVEAVARGLAAPPAGALVAWGEPTLRVPPEHGAGGRAQQLALRLARGLRGTDRSALVVGTDGIDGPAPPGRPAPAGAWVDGATWDAIVAAGLDPEAALARCDAGTALDAVGALVVTGPTGINHADLMIVG